MYIYIYIYIFFFFLFFFFFRFYKLWISLFQNTLREKMLLVKFGEFRFFLKSFHSNQIYFYITYPINFKIIEDLETSVNIE